MKKTLLLIILALTGFTASRAEVFDYDLANCVIPDGWKVNANVNTSPTSIYWEMTTTVSGAGYPAFKSGGAISTATYTNVKIIKVRSRGSNIRLQYKQGMSWIDIATICASWLDDSESGWPIDTTVEMPDAVRFSSRQFRFYVENGGSQWIEKVSIITGDSSEEISAPEIDASRPGYITINRTAHNGSFLYYHGVKANPADVLASEWRQAVDPGFMPLTYVTFRTSSGVNYVHTYQLAPNSNYTNSPIVSYGYNLADLGQLPAPTIDVADGVITITNNALSGTICYYNGPIADPAEVPQRSWDMVFGTGIEQEKVYKAGCIDGANSVHAYIMAVNINSSNSPITTVAYNHSGITAPEASAADLVAVSGRNIIAPQGAEVYTLGGLRVAATDLTPGIYAVRIPGRRTVKVIVK